MKRKDVPVLLSQMDASLRLLIQYFLSELEGKEGAYEIVDTFRIVIANLSASEFAGTPRGIPPALTALPWQDKERLYRQFPALANSLFPKVLAKELIAEFHRFNRISDGWKQIESSG